MKRGREKKGAKQQPSARDVKEQELEALAEKLNAMSREQRVDFLVEHYGTPLSEDVAGVRFTEPPLQEQDTFKWFCAATILGHPVTFDSAKAAVQALAERGYTSAAALAAVTESDLLATLVALRPTSAARVANVLVTNAKHLVETFGGSITKFLAAQTPTHAVRAMHVFVHMGDATANLFLREMRLAMVVDPPPLEKVTALAERLAVDTTAMERRTRKFVQLEAALYRLAAGTTMTMLQRKPPKKRQRVDEAAPRVEAREEKQEWQMEARMLVSSDTQDPALLARGADVDTLLLPQPPCPVGAMLIPSHLAEIQAAEREALDTLGKAEEM